MTDERPNIHANLAVDLLRKHLQAIPHPTGLLRLTAFSHESPGIREVKQRIAEGLVMLLESNGFHVLNGLTEAIALLQAHGYEVKPSERDTD